MDLMPAQWFSAWSAASEAPFIALAALVAMATTVAELLHRYTRIPRVAGYAATGLLFGALGLTHVPASLPLTPWTRLIFDLALGVLLFELGGRVRLGWLRHNPWILAQAVLAAAAVGIAAFWALTSIGVAASTALACALVSLAGSPAVLLRTVSDSGASGQVTERALVFTAIGTLLAVIGGRVLAGWLLHEQSPADLSALADALYLLGGSALMAAALAWLSTTVAARTEAGHENSMLLQLSVLALAVLGARALSLSSLLVPLLAGLLIKQVSPRPWVWPRQFGTAAGVGVVLMFVLTTAAWNPGWAGLALGPAAVLLGVRWLAGGSVLLLLARPSGGTERQALATSLCLVPMCGTVLVVASDIAGVVPAGVLPNFVPIVVMAVAMAEGVGAVLAWLGLKLARETSDSV